MASDDDIKAWVNAANAISSAHRMEMCMMALMVITMIGQTGLLVYFEFAGNRQVISEVRAVPDMIQHVRIESKYGRFDKIKDE